MWNQRLFMSLAVLGLCTVAACKNPRYCAGNPDDDCRDNDAAASCASDVDCAAPTAVCDTAGSHTCVLCTATDHAACSGLTPACVDAVCQPCTTHAQCAASNACLPDGSCADTAQVAYVDQNGADNAECSAAMPCKKIMAALATPKPYVKVHGTIDEQVSIGNRDVTFLADPGAKLIQSSNGLLLQVTGTSHVAIYDLEVTGASGGAGVGFGISLLPGYTGSLELRRSKITNNTASGISVSAGTLTVSQSTITGNVGGGISLNGGAATVTESEIGGNTGGGIFVQNSVLGISRSTLSKNVGGGITISGGQFAIVGNFFFSNGAQDSSTGGVSILTSQSASNRLEFNSFNKNQTQNTVGSAIQCVAGVFTARNNILSGNGTLTNLEQTGGSCSHAYSVVQPGTVPGGSGNLAADPRFADTTTGDLHLLAMSPAIGAADPASDLSGIAARDIDGDLRTRPADIGADERP